MRANITFLSLEFASSGDIQGLEGVVAALVKGIRKGEVPDQFDGGETRAEAAEAVKKAEEERTPRRLVMQRRVKMFWMICQKKCLTSMKDERRKRSRCPPGRRPPRR